MNGKLFICLLSAAAMAVTVQGACDPLACTSEASDYGTATTVDDICRLGKVYFDCLKTADCLSGAVGDALNTALENNKCNSSGSQLIVSMTCLFLSFLLNKLIN